MSASKLPEDLRKKTIDELAVGEIAIIEWWYICANIADGCLYIGAYNPIPDEPENYYRIPMTRTADGFSVSHIRLYNAKARISLAPLDPTHVWLPVELTDPIDES